MKIQPQSKWFLIGGVTGIAFMLFFQQVAFKAPRTPDVVVHDTVYLPESTKTILQKSDSISIAFGVPPNLVREIGDNETGWRHIHNHDGSSRGDLQVIGATFKHWYKELNLKGGKTRENYLIVGIAYLKYCYDFSGSWKKARYVYARGKWNPEWKWTALERKFMQKIDWSVYD